MGFTRKSKYRPDNESADDTRPPADRIDPDDHHSLFEYESNDTE